MRFAARAGRRGAVTREVVANAHDATRCDVARGRRADDFQISRARRAAARLGGEAGEGGYFPTQKSRKTTSKTSSTSYAPVTRPRARAASFNSSASSSSAEAEAEDARARATAASSEATHRARLTRWRERVMARVESLASDASSPIVHF